jgi:hypothetical protein
MGRRFAGPVDLSWGEPGRKANVQKYGFHHTEKTKRTALSAVHLRSAESVVSAVKDVPYSVQLSAIGFLAVMTILAAVGEIRRSKAGGGLDCAQPSRHRP